MLGKLLVFAVTFILVSVLISCHATSSTEVTVMPSSEKAMKGYELYSWQPNSEWYFALVTGTNRLKTFDEVAAPDVAVHSVHELRASLSQLPRGEEVVWITWMDDRLSLPPQTVIDEVKMVCQDLGLQLTIALK